MFKVILPGILLETLSRFYDYRTLKSLENHRIVEEITTSGHKVVCKAKNFQEPVVCMDTGV